jgi:probable HAF family extracellular repeat protein
MSTTISRIAWPCLMIAALGAVSCTSDRTPTDPSAEINERAARTSAWTIQDLGTLGGTFSTATAINAAGVVVGSSNLTEGGFRHAFVWQDGVMSDLGTPGVESEATAINRRDVIVGWSRVAGEGQRAVRWVNGTIEDLGVGGPNSQAVDINDFGVIVGWSGGTDPFRDRRAFRWEDGVLTDLGTLGGTWATAGAINNRGIIVGASEAPGGDLWHAFRWEKGVMQDLGTGGRMPPSAATDINDKGEIVGYLGPELDSQGSELERRLPFLYSHGVLAEIGDLGQQTFPNGISHRSLIVGERLEDPFDAFGTRDAWVWENGVFTLLPELSDGNSSALGVNRRDEIVGYSQNTAEGFTHAVLWRR